MNFETLSKFTTHLKKTLLKATELAQEWGHRAVNPEHLVYSLLFQRGSLGSEILNKSGVKREVVKQTILEENASVAQTTGGFDFSAAAREALLKATATARQYHHKYIGTEHLLYALSQLKYSAVQAVFQKSGINLELLNQQLVLVMKSTSKFPDLTEIFDKNGEFAFSAEGGTPTPALNFFCTDLTSDNVQQKIDPVIGRIDEIDRLIHILSRRTKNNPVLIGDPGVGKTAIVEGLAKKIVNHDVPDVLLNKRILNLDLGLVVAGTIYRGEFEGRFKQIIDEIKKDPNVILFIDELHTIIGTGGATGTLDAANILKPALAKGEIRCIGATTLDEYRKHIESDPALERRFQPILIEEPTAEETYEVLRGIKKNYEQYHRVIISDEAINAAVRLSQRYQQDKFFPDKAIDLIDEAASKLKVGQKPDGLTRELIRLEEEIKKYEQKKHLAVTAEQFPEAMRLKTQQELLRRRISLLKDKQRQEQVSYLGEIGAKDIAEIVARQTKIPLRDLLKEEKDKLLNLEKTMSERIIGQPEAISAVAHCLRRSRAGLSAPSRPLGSFLFLGPSGVGKTELAKVIAEVVFEDPKALLRIDMSEFGESFQASKLIGAPPGYVGYKEGGKLTEVVRRKPYLVVLFDEIEKAHADVFNLLLQVLEDGHLTDAVGKKVNFKNTIIVMTSNVGVAELNQMASLGFQAETARPDFTTKYEDIKKEILADLKKAFRPEFLNRLDHIIVFRPLSQTDVEKIAELQLKELEERLHHHQLSLKPSRVLIKHLARTGFKPDEGARAVRKIIQDEIEAQLAEKIITGELSAGSAITLDVVRNKIAIRQ